MFPVGTQGYRGVPGMMGGFGMPNAGEALVQGAESGFNFAQNVMDAPLRRQMLQNQVDEQGRRAQWEMQDRDFLTTGRSLDAADQNEQALLQSQQHFYSQLPKDQSGQIDRTQLTPDQLDQMDQARSAADAAHSQKMKAFHDHYGQDFVDLNKNLKKTASALHSGQMNWEDLPPENAYVLLGAATGGNLGAYTRGGPGGPQQNAYQEANTQGAIPNPSAQNPIQQAFGQGKSQIETAIDQVSHGLQNKDQGSVVQGANILFKPMLDRGIGERQPNGITTQKQEFVGFVPGPGGKDSFLPIVKITGTTDDGRTVSYTAGVPNDNDHGPNAQYVPHSMHDWMDYMQKQRQMVDIVNHPGMLDMLQKGAESKQAQATLADWKHSYDVFGKGGVDQLPKGKYQLKNTDLGNADQQQVFDEERGQTVSTTTTPKGVSPNIGAELASREAEGAENRASQERRTEMVANSRVAAAGTRAGNSQFQQKVQAIRDLDLEPDEENRLIEALAAPASVRGAGGGVSEKEINDHLDGMLATLMGAKGFSRDKTTGDWVSQNGVRLGDDQVRGVSDVAQALAAERQRLSSASKTERAAAATAPKKKATQPAPAKPAIVGTGT